VQSSCGHASIVIPPTKLEATKHLEVISLSYEPNAKQLQQLGRFRMQNHQFKKMIMLRPFLIDLTLE